MLIIFVCERIAASLTCIFHCTFFIYKLTIMNLIDKYNVSVPRYTSYPPANYFRAMQPEEYIDAVCRSNDEGTSLISFYLHMPFCKRLCHYCGCNSYILPRTGDTVARYFDAIHKEIDIVTANLDKNRPISQIHFGGGSPTAMPASVLKEINDHLRQQLSVTLVISQNKTGQHSPKVISIASLSVCKTLIQRCLRPQDAHQATCHSRR